MNRKYKIMLEGIMFIQKRIKGYIYKKKFYKDRLVQSIVETLVQIYNKKYRASMNRRNQRVSTRNVEQEIENFKRDQSIYVQGLDRQIINVIVEKFIHGIKQIYMDEFDKYIVQKSNLEEHVVRPICFKKVSDSDVMSIVREYQSQTKVKGNPNDIKE